MARTITRDIDPLSFPEKKTLLLLLCLNSPRGLPYMLGDRWWQEGAGWGGDSGIMLCTSHSFSLSLLFFFCCRCICFTAILIMLTQGHSLALDHQKKTLAWRHWIKCRTGMEKKDLILYIHFFFFKKVRNKYNKTLVTWLTFCKV